MAPHKDIAGRTQRGGGLRGSALLRRSLCLAGWLLSLTACSRGSPKPPVADLTAPESAAAAPTVTVACAKDGEKPTAASAPPLGILRQPAVARLDDKDVRSAVYAIGEPPANPPVLRPGPEDDRQLVEVYCVGCHSTAYIATQPALSRAQWEAEVQKMRSAFGAVVPDPAAQRIATFLHAYYGRR